MSRCGVLVAWKTSYGIVVTQLIVSYCELDCTLELPHLQHAVLCLCCDKLFHGANCWVMLCAGVDWSASDAAALTPELLNSALLLSGNATSISSSSSSGERPSQVQLNAGLLHDLGSSSDSDSSSDDETDVHEASSNTNEFDEDVDESDAAEDAAAAEPAEGLLEAAGASVGWSR